jgi:hypothetical protein
MPQQKEDTGTHMSECEIDEHGTKSWYLDGKRHREDGPAIEYAYGTKSWYIDGKLHREDGPASVGCNGDKSWHINGQLHREDGPAVERHNGTKRWYIDGIEVTEAEVICRNRQRILELI